MRFHELAIRRFRAIRADVTLDLDAAVTVLYAPNGTGKTTTCDAAEWLLTGRVSRLERADEKSGETGVRSWFPEDPSLPTEVEARLTVCGEELRVVRRLEGDAAPLYRLREGADPERLDEVTAFREMLRADSGAGSARIDASVAVLAGDGRARRIEELRDRLRAVRFVDGHALDALLDVSEESRDARHMEVSGLFGVRHLEERRRSLDAIDRQLPTAAALDAEVDALTREVEGREAASAGDGESGGPLADRIAALERDVGIEPGQADPGDAPAGIAPPPTRSGPDLGGALARIRLVLADRDAALTAQEAARAEVDAWWAKRDAQETRASEHRKRLDALTGDELALDRESSRVPDALDASTTSALTGERAELRERLARLDRLVAEAAEAAREVDADDAGPLAFAAAAPGDGPSTVASIDTHGPPVAAEDRPSREERADPDAMFDWFGDLVGDEPARAAEERGATQEPEPAVGRPVPVWRAPLNSPVDPSDLASRRTVEAARLRREADELTARRDRVRVASREAPARLAAAQHLATVEETLAEIHRELAEGGSPQRLDDRLLTLRARAESLRAKLEAAGGALERLRADAAVLVAHETAGGAGDCPVCGHAHGSAANLHEALVTALASTPPDLRALTTDLASVSAEAASVADTRDRLSRLVEREAALTRRRAELRSALAATPDLSREDLPPDDAGALAARVVELEARAAAAEQRAREAEARRDRALLLGAIDGELTAFLGAPIRRAEPATRGEDEAGFPLAFSAPTAAGPTSPSEARARAIERLREIDAVLERDAANRAAAAELRRRRSGMADERTLLSLAITRLAEESRAFDRAWRAFVGEFEVTDAARDTAARSVEEERARLTAQSRCADVLAGEIERSEARRRGDAELEALRVRLARARRSRAGWTRWRTDLRGAIAALEDRLRGRITAEVAGLSDLVAAIFGRSQANTVFDAVDAAPDREDALQWLARVGEHRVDDSVHLSRGQRQDLALAMFLARARCLGGTFFLDEPLLHLDDLNRVALLDVLRVLVLADDPAVHLVVTSANRPLVRHIREKFGLLPPRGALPVVRVYTASGTPRSGVTVDAG